MNIQTIGPRNFMATRGNVAFTSGECGPRDGYAGSVERFDVNSIYLEPAPARASQSHGLMANLVGGLMAGVGAAALACAHLT